MALTSHRRSCRNRVFRIETKPTGTTLQQPMVGGVDRLVGVSYHRVVTAIAGAVSRLPPLLRDTAPLPRSRTQRLTLTRDPI